MDDIAEKRRFGERTGAETLFVAASLGVAAVNVSDGRVGEFGIERRCSPTDIAGGERIAVATSEDVLRREGEEWVDAGFGAATAVGGDGSLFAAAPGGRIGRFDGSWTTVGDVDASVRAIDGDLVATDRGIYRVREDVSYAGLEDATDVAARGGSGPLAATADGLYALGNGWMRELDGEFRAVAVTPGHAIAAAAGSMYERIEGEWVAADPPVDEPVIDAAYGDCAYALTEDGTLLARLDDEWRSHALGLEDAVGLAVRG